MEGKMRYPPIQMYGQTGCEDTERARIYFTDHNVPFQETNIDYDPQAEAFVRFWNAGQKVTPTIVFGEKDYRVVLVEPDDARLEEVLRTTLRP